MTSRTAAGLSRCFGLLASRFVIIQFDRSALKSPSIKGSVIIIGLLAGTAFCDPASTQTCPQGHPRVVPDSRYSNHGDGTITDQQTSLMWKRCGEGQSGSNCTGSVITNTWAQALTSAANSTFAGYEDWRIPNVKELRSLIETGCYGPAINTNQFPNSLSSEFWSSTSWSISSSQAWFVDFSLGGVGEGSKSNSFGLRLVRAAANGFINSPPAVSYSPTPNATISYSGTGTASPVGVAPSSGGGSGSAATTTVGACTISGGGAAFPTTSIAQLSFVGPTTTSQNLVLPNCVPQASLVNAVLTCPEVRAGVAQPNRTWTLTCPSAAIPPMVAYSPTPNSTVSYSGAGTASPISVTPSGGSGSGVGASTTVGACTITGGGAAFPTTTIAQLTFVGQATSQNLVLPNCVPQASLINVHRKV